MVKRKRRVLAVIIAVSMVFSSVGFAFAEDNLDNVSTEKPTVTEEIKKEEPQKEEIKQEEPKKEEEPQVQEENKQEKEVSNQKTETKSRNVKSIEEPQVKDTKEKKEINYPIYVNWYVKSRDSSGKEITKSKLNQKISGKDNQKTLDINSYSTVESYETKDSTFTFTGKWKVVCNDYEDTISPQKISVGGTDCIGSPTIRVSSNANVTITAVYDKEDKPVVAEPHTATVYIHYMNQDGEWEDHSFSNIIDPGDSWTIMESAFDDDIDLVDTIYCDKKEYKFIGWNPQLPLTISDLTEDTEYHFTAQYTNKDIYHFNFNAIGKITTTQNNWEHNWTNSNDNSVFSNYTWNCKSPGNMPSNYLFEYWIDSEDSSKTYKVGDKFTYDKELVKDTSITLYAVYQPITTIEYCDEENKIIGIVSNTSINIYNDFQAPEKKGKFIGWYYDKERTQKVPDDAIKTLPLTQDKVQTTFKVYAKYSYTVTWVNDNGTQLEIDENVSYGDMPSYDGDTPTKQRTPQYSYQFKDWTPTISKVTENITYTAEYNAIINQYTVKFVDEDGTELSSKKYNYGATPIYERDTPVKTSTDKYSYEFDGWTPEISEVTEDATYTATYKATVRKYTVTYKPGTQGTFKETSTTVEYGSNTPAAPKTTCNKDYEFKNWSPSVANTVTGDATYVAQWEKIEKEEPVTPVKPDPSTPDKPKPKPHITNTVEIIYYGMGDVVNKPTAKKPSIIQSNPLPLTPTEQYWALLNLLFALATCVLAFILIIFGFLNKTEEDEDIEIKNKWWARITAGLIGIASLIIFFLTENMNNPWIWIDKWTLLMGIIFVINIVFMFIARHKEEEIEEEE